MMKSGMKRQGIAASDLVLATRNITNRRWALAAACLAAGLAGAFAAGAWKSPVFSPARLVVTSSKAEPLGATFVRDALAKASGIATSQKAIAELSRSLAASGLPVRGASSLSVDRIQVSQADTSNVLTVAVHAGTVDGDIMASNYLANMIVVGAQPVPHPKVETAEISAPLPPMPASAELKAQRDRIDAMRMKDMATVGQIEAAKRRASVLADATATSVVKGQLPSELMTTQMEKLVADYAGAKATFDEAALKYGPQHPRIRIARNDLHNALAAISLELREMSTREASNVRELAARQADEESDLAAARITLNQLEKKANAEVAAAAKPAIDPIITGPVPAVPVYSLISPARYATPGGVSALVYQLEAVALGVLAAIAVLARGLNRALEPEVVPVLTPIRRKAPVQRGILEQIEMLEQFWPSTGRSNLLPEAVNDDPEQKDLEPARQIVVRMDELRREAHKASADQSEEALGNVLVDIQALRDRIKWISAEQQRKRRSANGAS